MPPRDYGRLKPLYIATEKAGGRLKVFIRHDNQAVHADIRRHQKDPHWFSDHYGTWSTSNIRAKYWLAFLVSEFTDYFESDRVDFIWSSAPPSDLPTGLPPPSHIGPEAPPPSEQVLVPAPNPAEAAWEHDLVLVVDRSTKIEGILIRTFKARGPGLGKEIDSVEHKLPLLLCAQLRDIAGQRNPIAHPLDKITGKPIVPKPRLRSREGFSALCDAAMDELAHLTG